MLIQYLFSDGAKLRAGPIKTLQNRRKLDSTKPLKHVVCDVIWCARRETRAMTGWLIMSSYNEFQFSSNTADEKMSWGLACRISYADECFHYTVYLP